MQVNLYNRAYLIYNISISINNHTTSQDSKLIQLKTQQTSVSGRNHLTCAFLTSGHILRLSSRLSPSLTTSHPHIKFRAAILQAQLTHLTFLFFFMWPLLELSSRLSSRFHIQWRLNTSLSLTITHLSHQHSFNSQHVSISHFNNLSHFITHAHHISITTSYSIHKPTIHIMYILNSYHITNSYQITYSLIFYIYSKELTYILLY